MSTEPTTLPRTQPDWAMLALFALLAGGAVYALYYAFSMQSLMNRQLAGQNAAYIREQLDMFKARQRINEVMYPVIANLTEQDFADLAGNLNGIGARRLVDADRRGRRPVQTRVPVRAARADLNAGDIL